MLHRSLARREVFPCCLLLGNVLVVSCGAPVLDEPGVMDAGRAPIISGTPTGADEYPAVASVLGTGTYQDSSSFARLLCTATLITPGVLLCAAHCLDPDVIANVATMTHFVSFSADVSAFSTASPSLPADTIEVRGVVSHPEFSLADMLNGVSGLGQNYDIGLILLQEPATDRPTAFVLGPNDGARIAMGAAVNIVGYGASENASRCDATAGCGIKRKAASSVHELATYEMQIGGVDPDPRKCHGDSGGPTFMTVNDGASPAERIIGVTSHSYDAAGCTQGAVDTRVDAYREWINAAMVAACQSNDRVDCEGGGALPEPTWSDAPSDDSGNGGCSCRAQSVGAELVLVGILLFAIALRRRHSA